MPKRKTQEEFVNELSKKNPTVKLVGPYVNARDKTKFLCLIHNKPWDTSPYVVLQGHGCSICHSERTRESKVWSREKYVQELAQRNPSVELIGEYLNTQTQTKHHCLVHDVYWDVMPADVLKGSGCEKCRSEKLSKAFTKSKEQYIDDLTKRNPKIILLGDYINDRTKTLHKCLVHNKEWMVKPNQVLQGSGCSECRLEITRTARKKSAEKYIEELAIKNPSVQLLGEYINNKTETLHFCTIHNKPFDKSPEDVLKGYSCPDCHYERLSKAKRKTHEQYVEQVKKITPHIKVMGQYETSLTPIKHYCSIHDRDWYPTPSSILVGSGCPECCSDRIREKNIKSNDQYLEDLIKVNPGVKPLENYIDATTPILHFHINCGHTTMMTPSSVLSGNGCRICRDNRIGKASLKTQETFEQDLSIVNPNIKVVGKYITSSDRIDCECLVCGHKWKPRAGNLLSGHGCPKCNKPIGERVIGTYLDANGIEYTQNKMFKGLTGVGGSALTYDFHVPRYKLLIEFQGEQHERPIEFFGGEETFAIQKEHDMRKKKYALSNGYNFLQIFYRDINYIDSILDNYLLSLKSETVTTTGVV